MTATLAGDEQLGIYGAIYPDIQNLARQGLEKGSHTIAIDMSTHDRNTIGRQNLEHARKKIHSLAREYGGNPRFGTGRIHEDMAYVLMGPEVGIGPVDFENSSLVCFIEVVFSPSAKSLS